jgi:excisionase family DNA binding protein
MAADAPNYLTTGEAAQLCSVTPDAVLKWIKKRQLPAVTTAGGHHRILYRDLAKFLKPCGEALPPSQPQRPLRCWEYMCGDNPLAESCRQCFVYRVGAAWCFEAVALAGEQATARTYCHRGCASCAYYQRVKAPELGVVIVSREADVGFISGGATGDGLTVTFAANAYEAAAAIHDLHPVCAVVDEDLPDHVDIVRCISSDPHAWGLKILLASGPNSRKARAGGGVAGAIEKPLDRSKILQTVAAFPVERQPETRDFRAK